jgi:hypothetical protein
MGFSGSADSASYHSRLRDNEAKLNNAGGVVNPDSAILVNFDYLPARTIRDRFQLAAVIFGVLLRRAGTNVEQRAS